MARVLIAYYSKSGNTEAMAGILGEAVRAAGAETTLKRAEDTEKSDLVAADAVAIGSPDYYSYPAGQVKVIFDEALEVKSKLSGKPALCFASHGGGGKLKKPFEDLMKAIGLKLVAPCVLCQEAPAGEAVEEIRKAGKALVGAIGKKG
jgi:NAD(P)H dehydrogenase (quinone)